MLSQYDLLNQEQGYLVFRHMTERGEEEIGYCTRLHMPWTSDRKAQVLNGIPWVIIYINRPRGLLPTRTVEYTKMPTYVIIWGS